MHKIIIFLMAAQLPFIYSLLLLLILAKLFGEIMERFKQPAMIGEILAGILLGPSILGWVEMTPSLSTISDLAVFFLVIYAGFEINITDILNSIKGKGIWVALLAFILPFSTGLGVGMLFDFNPTISTFLGLCIAITALPVSVRILMDLNHLRSEIGKHIVSAAVFNDVVAFLALGIILNFNQEQYDKLGNVASAFLWTLVKISFFAMLLFVAYRLLDWMRTRILLMPMSRFNRLSGLIQGKEGLFAASMVFILFFAAVAEMNNLHFIIGAFFGAMLLPREFFSYRNRASLINTTSSITNGFLSPIFFALLGVECHFQSISNVPLLLLVLGVSFLSKILGGFISGRLLNYSPIKSLTLGIGLNARGIMELVIANIALSYGFIDVPFFSMLVLMGMITTMTTPSALKWGIERIQAKGERV